MGARVSAASPSPVTAVVVTRRLPGWEERLDAVIEDARRRPYELGHHDCFLLALAVLKAITGVDRFAAFAGYSTKRQALAQLAEWGSTFEAAGDKFFGSDRLPWMSARRGDICAYTDERGEKHLAICGGAMMAALGPEGLVWIPMHMATCCWRVG